MDSKKLDKDLSEIILKKQELEKLDYNDPKYDELEDALHDLEDAFVEEFGDFLEEKLQEVHDRFCPETDVLSPTAYIGKGIVVDLEKYPGKEARLVLNSNPTSIALAVRDKQEIVWRAD
ncbi:MAG TPA: hypothetical protein PLV21_15330 [Cyclobacteriaceae bacterium]|nr:hypothetical protein [Cyclobacteriaceae bacterium]HRJ83259.1 hypothetical protein [Cyclobacteriaceae bacterium]